LARTCFSEIDWHTLSLEFVGDCEKLDSAMLIAASLRSLTFSMHAILVTAL